MAGSFKMNLEGERAAQKSEGEKKGPHLDRIAQRISFIKVITINL
jgi:hypothetical protein